MYIKEFNNSMSSLLGVRLYFILTPGNDLYGHPSQLQLAHVRMPPGFAPGLMMDKPTNVRTAFYRKGIDYGADKFHRRQLHV